MRAFPITKRPLTVVTLALLVCVAVCMPQLAAGGILYTCGRDWSGILDAPSGNDYVDVEARGYYSVAIRADRTLVAWGYDYWKPVSTLPGGTFAQVSCNDEHALGLRTDGSLVRFTVRILREDEATAEASFFDLAPRIMALVSAYVPE